MKRAVLQDIKKLALEDVPKPACPRDGLILEVKACAVCATDVKIYNYGHRLIRLPRVLGHEVSGVISDVGKGMAGRFRAGQRVAICAVVNCGECVYCQRAVPSMCMNLQAFGYHFDGGYQEYMVVPHAAIRCGGVHELATNISFAEASIAELLACCINGQRLSRVSFSQSMLIIGAGPVGILHATLACSRGLAPVFLADIDPDRLGLAESICGGRVAGYLLTDNPDTVTSAVSMAMDGLGFDQVVVCCSAPAAQEMALQFVAKCGCVNLFGGLPEGRSRVSLDTNHIHYKQCTVIGTHGSSAEDNRIALDLINRGAIEVKHLLTERTDLSQLEKKLQLGRHDVGQLKTVIEF